MIYLDSSAILKLLNQEAESEALQERLDRYTGHLVSSTISRVEVIRSAHRHRLELLVEARRRLELIEMVAMTEEILSRAGDVEPRELRSLDAIHLATALGMKSEVQEFITYDRRLFEASARLGFEVSSPR